MAQVGWIYLDDFGSQHRVGLYHGDRTGHVLLHCDLRILQVDFSVKETQTYSFFVEDELCEVSIFKEKEGYSYDFQVNKKIDTPRNRLRKADYRRTLKKLGFVVLGLIVFVASVFISLRWWGNQQVEKYLSATSMGNGLNTETLQQLTLHGQKTVVQMVVVDEGSKRRVFYRFKTEDEQQISGRFAVPDVGLIILPNSFPLSDGDAFSVRYLPDSPQVHQFDFEQPTANTLAGYLERARRAEVQAHPDATVGHSHCVARLTLQHKGWPYLADLIFQSTPRSANAKNNQESYLRLIREPDFANRIARECWDQ